MRARRFARALLATVESLAAGSFSFRCSLAGRAISATRDDGRGVTRREGIQTRRGASRHFTRRGKPLALETRERIIGACSRWETSAKEQ